MSTTTRRFPPDHPIQKSKAEAAAVDMVPTTITITITTQTEEEIIFPIITSTQGNVSMSMSMKMMSMMSRTQSQRSSAHIHILSSIHIHIPHRPYPVDTSTDWRVDLDPLSSSTLNTAVLYSDSFSLQYAQMNQSSQYNMVTVTGTDARKLW